MDFHSLAHFSAAPPSQNAAGPQKQSINEQKLRKAATEFESMLLSKWWSAMRDSGLSGSDETDPGHDTLDQLGMQALSTAIAGSGGIGLGAIMVRDLLSNSQDKPRPGK
jgi:Rod binding domain-containing protein